MAAPLQRLADHSEVYWLQQGEAAWPEGEEKKVTELISVNNV